MRKKVVKIRTRPALTLTEMLVAMIMVTIILSAAAVTMVYGHRALDIQWEQVSIQRDAMYAMQKIKQSIRSASLAVIEEDGNIVKVYNNGQWTKYKFVPGGKDLRYQLEGQTEEITIIDGIVESASFSIDPSTNSTVTINLYLKNGEHESKISSGVTMRNFITGS